MRLFRYRVYFRSRRHDYHELSWPSHREAFRFAVDWISEDPDVWKISVIDSSGRRDPFVLEDPERRASREPRGISDHSVSASLA